MILTIIDQLSPLFLVIYFLILTSHQDNFSLGYKNGKQIANSHCFLCRCNNRRSLYSRSDNFVDFAHRGCPVCQGSAAVAINGKQCLGYIYRTEFFFYDRAAATNCKQ